MNNSTAQQPNPNPNSNPSHRPSAHSAAEVNCGSNSPFSWATDGSALSSQASTSTAWLSPGLYALAAVLVVLVLVSGMALALLWAHDQGYAQARSLAVHQQRQALQQCQAQSQQRYEALINGSDRAHLSRACTAWWFQSQATDSQALRKRICGK